MIYSMTGYASHSARVGDAQINIDLRSVNQRYLEITFRMPDELRMYESVLREQISRRISRGKLECRISQIALPEAASSIGLNPAVLELLAGWQKQVQARFPDAAPLTTADVLRWSGVMSSPEGAAADHSSALAAAMEAVLQDMLDSREREGAKLRAHIEQRLLSAQQLIEQARTLLPGLLAAWREKLALRLREALGDGANGGERAAQEFAVFAQKIDVDEEISRFSSHIAEVRRVLDKGGAVGKRLDFLMQEMQREANTLGSKSVSVETTRISVELKVLVEQMREQIQNIE